MNTKFLFLIALIAILYFVHCYQDKLDKKKRRNKKKRVDQQRKDQRKIKYKSNDDEIEIKASPKKRVRINDEIDIQNESESDLEYNSLNGIDKEGDSLSFLDAASNDSDLSHYL